MDNKLILPILIVIFFLGAIAVSFFDQRMPITSFEECVAAGFPVMESYPRQCSDGTNTYTEELGLANPAAQYCENMGYTYTIVTEEEGQRGICSYHGNECDAWEFYRGECFLE